MIKVLKRALAGLAAASVCLIAASCYLGIDDEFLEIPFNPEWGELSIDGEAQAPVEGFVKIRMSSAERLFDFRPNAAHGWSFAGWNGMKPNPFPIADVPYSMAALSMDNPASLIVDKAFVSTYVYLAPKAERFEITDVVANSHGDAAFIAKYPDGSARTFLTGPSGSDARDVSALIPFPGDYTLMALSDSLLIVRGVGPGTGVGALDTARDAWRGILEASENSYELASPGGTLIGKVTQKTGGGTGIIEVVNAETGDSIYARDFSAETDRIAFLTITDTHILYTRASTNPGAREELHAIDIATGTDGGIGFEASYLSFSASPVAGSGTLALIGGYSLTVGGPSYSSTDYFIFDPDADSPYPLKQGNPSYLNYPVYAGENKVYLCVRIHTWDDNDTVLWDYVSDSYVECPLEGVIVSSGPEGLLARGSVDPVVDNFPNRSYVKLMIQRPDGTTSDITPYALILE